MIVLRPVSAATTTALHSPSSFRALRRCACLLALGAVALILAGPVSASDLIGSNATGVTLAADGSGRALVTFTSGGSRRHVLASGAVNARPPSHSVPQVEFNLDYSGGRLVNSCTPVKLPLAWFVAACQATDGSYWALQSWQRLLPNSGGRPSPAQAAWELRLSHWTGEAATFTVRFGWSYSRFVQLYGVYSYGGQPVFGYKVRSGVPLDGYGRNIYVDAFSSDIGRGWKRVNSFLAHAPVGAFCYVFVAHAGHTGVGKNFRATVIGPGVTPDVMWQSPRPGAYTRAADDAADKDMTTLLRGDSVCRPN
jgi:hypothetical protein